LALPADPKAAGVAGPNVTDDFPKFVPVPDRELDVIETYLGASLEEVLGR
jgi:hypothetical protein